MIDQHPLGKISRTFGQAELCDVVILNGLQSLPAVVSSKRFEIDNANSVFRMSLDPVN